MKPMSELAFAYWLKMKKNIEKWEALCLLCFYFKGSGWQQSLNLLLSEQKKDIVVLFFQYRDHLKML